MMNRLLLVSSRALLAATLLTNTAALELSVTLPQGETKLTEIGLYRVGWQSYGKEPQWMPLSWSGESDPSTGIAYQIKPAFLGREALLMHSPWRVPPGRAWAEYRISLPKEKPITFSFGIAMEPSSILPNKSDGVTFSCALSDPSGERELLRKHWAKSEWDDQTIDLSAEAGKTITLRLQVEPGPKNNSSWDFSHFGNPRITIGNKTANQTPLVAKLVESKAWKAVSKADMRALSNSPRNGIVPSNILPHRNSLQAEGTNWRFTYHGDDCRISYLYSPSSGTLDDLTASIDDGPAFHPALGGGAGARARLENAKPVSATRRGDELVVVWEYQVEAKPVSIEWTYQIIGKALRVSARCETPVIESFTLGRAAAPLRKQFEIPYLAGNVEFLPAQGVFVCRYLDWTKSNSSHCPQTGAGYETKTDGTRNPMFETGYIAVSPALAETLPNIPHPPSPFIKQLGPRIMLDVWGHHRGKYSGDTEILRELKDNGVDHLAIIQHCWQHFGYDVKLPDHIPADPRYGSEDDLAEYGRTAKESGYVWSLHENYIDLYPDAPSYDPTARVLKADRSPSPAWLNEGTGVQSFGLKCNRALGFAKQNSPEAHQRYGTNAAYLDVHSCVPPWHQLDHEANQPSAAIARFKVERDRELFQFERDTHEGPLFGEGNNHFYWAGLCDGVEAQVRDGEDHVPFLDFDLLKIHPQMVNHGMGYYERWFRTGRETRWGINAGSIAQLDKYRAMEIAYGHAGFVGNALTADIRHIVREHHLMHPVQRLYGDAKPVEIRYLVNGKFVSGGLALLAGDTSRQRIRYDSGLTVWINWSPQPWSVEGNVLPQWGFLATGPDTKVSTSLHDGKIADYSECPDFIFADARTSAAPSNRNNRKNIEPRLREFTHLGGNRVRVTYEWNVGESPGGDFHCFVHGTHPDAPKSDHIAFQQDHRPSKSTTEWKPGDLIVDGPYEFTIPTDRDWFDLTIGLYQDRRLLLKGQDDGTDRIVLARLMLDRKDGSITNIRREAPPKTKTDEPDIDFTAHTNPPGTWIDFGKLSTDGSLMIRREKDRLTIFPYPRDKAFRASIDVKAIAPAADLSKLKVRALAAGNAANLDPVETKFVNGRLTIPCGTPMANRYIIEWK